jgi:hypothetical protein
MGETNIVLEGPSDQYLLTELNRQFAMNRDHTKFLDLNSLILMSAESAPGVAKLLSASQWGDERIPACVVIFDNDDEGKKQRDIVTGEGKYKKLIDPNFVFLLSDSIGEKIGEQAILTTEDLVPTELFCDAIKEYLLKWYPDEFTQNKTPIEKQLSDQKFAEGGLVAATSELFKQYIHAGREFDKMGVFHFVVQLVEERLNSEGEDAAVSELERRLQKLCEYLLQKVDLSRQASRRLSVNQTVRREVEEFFKRFKSSAPAFDIVRLLNRIERELKEIGDDGEKLREAVIKMQQEIDKFRQSGETRVTEEYWQKWSSAFWLVKKNPLAPGFSDFKEVEISEYFKEPAQEKTGLPQPSPPPVKAAVPSIPSAKPPATPAKKNQ